MSLQAKSPPPSGRKRVEKHIGQQDTNGPIGWLLRLFKSISTFVLIFLEQGAVHGLAHLGKPFLHILENKNGISKEEDQAELYDFLESLANSSYFNFENIKHSDNVDSMLDMLQIKPENYMMVIYNLTRDLTRLDDTELRVRTQSNLEYLRTYQTLTEYGICYTTNSFISSNLTASLLLTGKQTPLDDFYMSRVVHNVRYGNLFDGDITYSFIGFEPPITVNRAGGQETFATQPLSLCD
uniref:Uncharacterized protein n=1 Tax=Anopheles maculatus TaxID=74869 RepID=A0A182SHV8_9DIPT